jgi:hypothetical protein
MKLAKQAAPHTFILSGGKDKFEKFEIENAPKIRSDKIEIFNMFISKATSVLFEKKHFLFSIYKNIFPMKQVYCYHLFHPKQSNVFLLKADLLIC